MPDLIGTLSPVFPAISQPCQTSHVIYLLEINVPLAQLKLINHYYLFLAFFPLFLAWGRDY